MQSLIRPLQILHFVCFETFRGGIADVLQIIAKFLQNPRALELKVSHGELQENKKNLRAQQQNILICTTNYMVH